LCLYILIPHQTTNTQNHTPFLYALSPLIVRYSRASWNPNPLPFFTILGFYLLTIGINQKNRLKLFIAGACLGVAWQLHYLALILSPIYAVMLLDIFKRENWLSLKFSSSKIKQVLKNSLLVALGWLTTFSPFLAFEIRHNFPNTKTVFEFLTRKNSAVDTKLIDIITTFYTRTIRLFLEVFSLPNSTLVISLAAVSLIALIHASKKRDKTLLLWSFLGIAIMSVYQGDIHDYYFGFLFPVPFLATGIIIYLIWIRGWLARILVTTLLLATAGHFIQKAYFQHPPNRLIDQTQTITNIVTDMAAGEPYNFALIAAGNSDHAYRYFLNISKNPPKLLEEEVTAQLIIICEQPQETCEPRGHPLWEVAGFGRKEIESVQKSPVGDISVYKTIHHESSLDMIGKPVILGE